MAETAANPPITWGETRARLAADRARLRDLAQAGGGRTGGGRAPRWLCLHPSYQCVALHRLAHYCNARGFGLLGRLFWHLDLLLTGADIAAISQIGGGLVVRHPASCIVVARLGRDCTLMGQVGLGGGMGDEDVGAGPGLPVVGDGVTLGFGALVLGPVRIGDRARIGPRCLVTRDVPADAAVEAAPPRRSRPRTEGDADAAGS